MSRVFALGLDGVGLDLWTRLCDRGWLPTLSGRLRSLAPLSSTIPPLTAPAWTSIATGLNPGRHGVLDFWTRPGRGEMPRLIGNSATLAFWEVASAQGFRVGIFNYPLSYPPRAVNGFWVSGMNTPRHVSDFATPPDLASQLSSFVPDAATESTGSRDLRHRPNDRLELIRELIALQDNHLEAGLMSLRHSVAAITDLFVFALTTTDRFLHFFWDCVAPVASTDTVAPEQALLDLAAEFWRRLDFGVSRWLDLARPDTLLLFSDHGFQSAPSQVFNMPVWLRSIDWASGAIRVARPGPLALVMGSAKDVAKRLLPTSVWRRFRARYSESTSNPVVGSVSSETLYGQVIGLSVTGNDDERRTLIERAIGAARETRDRHGYPIFDWAERGPTVWPGAPSTFPDVVLCLRADLGAGASASDPRPMFSSVSDRVGDHAPQGLLGISGAVVSADALPLYVWDVAPIVLHCLGAAIPADLDGVVPAWLPGERLYLPAQTQMGSSPSAGGYSSVQAAEITERLRMLGYVD